MDIDNVIDSELHDEGRKQAAWEKAYQKALDRWDELPAPERQRVFADLIANNDGVDAIATVLSQLGDKWRDRLFLIAEDIKSSASDAWARAEAERELEAP